MEPTDYLSSEQHGMAHMGCTGDGALVVLFRCNAYTYWMHRVDYTFDIRRQRMVVEGILGYINNRFHVHLGLWPFEEELFEVSYVTTDMKCNWRGLRRCFALCTISEYVESIAHEDRV